MSRKNLNQILAKRPKRKLNMSPSRAWLCSSVGRAAD